MLPSPLAQAERSLLLVSDLDLSQRSRQSFVWETWYGSDVSPERRHRQGGPDRRSCGRICRLSSPKRVRENKFAIYYVVCTADRIDSRGVIHMAVTALDLVKSNMQVSVFMLMMSSRFSIMPLPDPVNWHLAIDNVKVMI